MRSSFLFLLLIAGWTFFPTKIRAQGKPAAPSGTISSLTDQQMSGRGSFLQRCALCHLPKEVKPKTIPPVGPLLTGLFKGTKPDPDKEKRVREVIEKGSPNMPGFQHSLTPQEIDDLIAYLKTL